MKSSLLSCLLLGACCGALVVHVPGTPTLNTTLSAFLDPTAEEKTNLSVPLDPTLYPAYPPFVFDIEKLVYTPLNKGELFCHLLSNILYFWTEPTNLLIARSIQLVDQEYPNLRTFFNPPYLAHKRLNVRSVGYVLIDLVTWLFNHGNEWGFGYWIRVSDEVKAAEKAEVLLNVYIGLSRPNEMQVSNGTVLHNTAVTVSRTLAAVVSYTGTALTQRTIFDVFWHALIPIVGHDSAAPCGYGTGEMTTPDGSAKIVISVFDTHSAGRSHTNEDMARGIMEVLFFYVREDHWESSKATIRYNTIPFMAVSIEKISVGLPGSGSGNIGFGNETATS